MLLVLSLMQIHSKSSRSVPGAKTKENIIVINIFTFPEDIRTIGRTHPRLKTAASSIEDRSNEHTTRVPGLWNVRNRRFGTADLEAT